LVALRQRFVTRANSTPGRLTILLAALTALGVLTGLAAVVGASQRSGLVNSVASDSGPVAVQAQQLYRSLSDADATAAAAFLLGGAEPADLRQRYQNDIAAASASLVPDTATTERGQRQLAEIATWLPVYTGLVETARVYNRQNLPVGSAYLREASGVMRERLLPAASGLYQIETERLAGNRAGASQVPWVAIPLILLMLAGLVVAQIYLVQRTRRLLNVGLVVATAAGVVLLLWVTVSWIAVAANLAASDRDGSAQVEVIARARTAALQARADEALTLVARGSGGAFEQDYAAKMTSLAGDDGRGGLLSDARRRATDPTVRDALAQATAAVADWRLAHQQLRYLDDAGQYPEAVTRAVGGAKGGATPAFNRADEQLSKAIVAANETFTDRADRARADLVGTGLGWVLLTLIMVAGVVIGLQQRIAEYR
jgi:hypothetical protein